MNQQIRRLGIGLLVAYFVLFVQLNRLQVFDATEYNEHPSNSRPLVADFGAPRGEIRAADGTVLARSIDVEDGPFARQREYPLGELFAEVTGHFSFDSGGTGLEAQFDSELRGEQNELDDTIRELIGGDSSTADVNLTLSVEVQEAAREALGDRNGSVVVLNAQSGAVEALWSWPSYDPNLLSSLDTDAARRERQALLSAPGDPLLPKTIREIYFPGSTFKIVTASAALEAAVASLDVPTFPSVTSYTPPLTTSQLSNFNGGQCGGPMRDLIRRSCNAGFAQLAVELLGEAALIDTAERFGFNAVPPLELPGVEASVMPTDFGDELGRDVDVDPDLLRQLGDSLIPVPLTDDAPSLAQSAIGQFEVKATPLQMALVAATIANDGVVPTPHLIDTVIDSEGAVLAEGDLTPWMRAVRPDTAIDMREAMVEVVESGTGQSIAVDGLIVGAKTGTAQLGADIESTHAWVIAFAGTNPDRPSIAVAVLVEADEAIGEQTGGRVAGPVAQAVIAAWAATR